MDITQITPIFLIGQSPVGLISDAGFGRKSSSALMSLQQKIRGWFSGAPELNRLLMPEAYGKDLALHQIGQDLRKDIEIFSSTLPAQEKCIFIKRNGLGEEPLTLGELGNRFGVTRERIRQKEQGLMFDLQHSVRITAEMLSSRIDGLPLATVISEMSELRHAFFTDTGCLRMLAHLAGIDARDLLQKAAPLIPNGALDDFFYSANPPVQKSAALAFLQEEFDLEEDVAVQALLTLVKQEHLSLDGPLIHPKNAKKEIAIAHVLAKYPDGLGWLEIAQKVNAERFCRTQLSLERSDPTLNSSTYIFQSDQGLYSHIRYVNLSKDDIRYWLADIKAFLEQSGYKAVHLRTEYYTAKAKPKLDYYRIRYIARNFGARAGIYFNGRSQADTVSLETDAVQVSQKEALGRMMDSQPMSTGDITAYIHSQSELHALVYINELLSDGRIVRMENGNFAAPSIAFSDMDVGNVLEIIRSVLNGDPRVHHMGVLSSQVNRAAGLNITPRFCKSLVAAFAKREHWHRRGYLVASRPFKWSGLSEVVREAPDMQGEDLIAWVQQKVCATRDAVKRAVHNSGVLRSQSENTVCSEGLASDLMQELFEL